MYTAPFVAARRMAKECSHISGWGGELRGTFTTTVTARRLPVPLHTRQQMQIRGVAGGPGVAEDLQSLGRLSEVQGSNAVNQCLDFCTDVLTFQQQLELGYSLTAVEARRLSCQRATRRGIEA